MSTHYEISVRVPLRKLLPGVSDIEDSVNKTMSEFGFSEKMVVTSVIPLKLSTAIPITAEEQAKMESIIIELFTAQYGTATIEKFVMVNL